MIFIVSPHIDDAFLSIAGCILNWIKKGEKIKVIYIFSKSLWTNPQPISSEKYAVDESVITNLRKKEEEQIQQTVRHDFVFLDFCDEMLRKCKQEPADVNDLSSRIKAGILSHITKDALIYFPIGIDNLDHIIIRDIGISFYREGFPVRFYEDMPYMAASLFFKNVYYSIKKNNYTALLEEIEEIDLEEKLRIIKNYKSQVSEEWLTNIAAYSYSLRDNLYYERTWKPGNY